MYTYIHTKVFDSCAFVCLLASFQYLPVYQMIHAHSSLRISHQRKCLFYCLYESRFFLICISGPKDRSFICLAQTSCQRIQPITWFECIYVSLSLIHQSGIYLLSYLRTYLFTYFTTAWLIYLLTYLLTYWLTYSLTYLLTNLLTYLPTYLLTYLLIH